jgi:putative salt-induced outer membrane protein YdiY
MSGNRRQFGGASRWIEKGFASMRYLNLQLFFCLSLATVAASLEARPKRDVLYLKNGDRLTCEIKSLDKGQLTVKTNYINDTFVIDWNEVERIESPQRFQVETQDGSVLAGALEKKLSTSQVSVIDGAESNQVPQLDVVWMKQDQESVLGKLDLNVDYGFSFTKANATVSSNLDVSADYITTQWEVSNDTNFSFNGQDNGTDSSREQINNSIRRRLAWKHWFAGGLANFLSNSEQQLDLRSTFGGGIGREFIHTNKTLLSALVGAGYSREQYSQDSGQTKQDNAEALLGLSYSWFHFDSSEFDFSVLAHPSLTDIGRVRIDLNTGLYLSLLGDNLYWKISFYDNYDSRPPSGVSKNDAGISTSIGWSIF